MVEIHYPVRFSCRFVLFGELCSQKSKVYVQYIKNKHLYLG